MAYTSGTTGNPKGTMLSHDAVTYTAVQNTDLFCWDYGVESVLSYLPLSHVAGQMMDVFLIMSKGGTCCFADKNALRGNLLENMKHFRPSRFVGVPRVFEKIEEGMKAAGAKSGLKKKVTRKYENRLYDEKQRILPRKSGLGLKKKVRKCLPAAYSSDKT